VDHLHPGVVSAADHLSRFAPSERKDRNAQLDGHVDGVGVELRDDVVHAEGLRGQLPDLADLLTQLVRFSGQPTDDPETAGVAHRRHELRGGVAAHTRLEDRKLDAEQVAYARLEPGHGGSMAA